jgi:signal transduction histidine kinase
VRGSPPRAVYAAFLLAAALAVLLVAWFLSGWADVRARQVVERTAPAKAADSRGAELAHDLRTELSALMTREVERPYFHYQNLFHDPRTRGGVSVAPSPLAIGPEDPFVMGYFQLDAKGRATTPTVNDDVPDLSEPKRLAENKQFRDEVTRSLAVALAPGGKAGPPGAKVAPKPRVKAQAQMQQPPAEPQAPSQVVTIDNNTYAQNYNSNAIYQQSDDQAAQQQIEQLKLPEPVPSVRPGRPTDPVTITVSPLEWRTLPFAGVPSLVAVRQVETPNGMLAQGFVVDRATLTSWLATHAGDAVAELHAGESGTTEIAPGWHLTVNANPRALADAAIRAARIATGFILRFVIVGVIAGLAAALVVLLVARAERLARERSQFAAAAAHELRTPLAGLQLYGDMLADGLGDPGKVRDYAKRMSEEASRLGRVVSNVLGFSQLERGNLSVEPRVGQLGLALCELAERAQPALDRAGAVLELDVAPELTATFDRDAVARIVGNLLDNAEKYGRDARDRTIGLAARGTGDHVEVIVSDHGPGVTQQARSRLFRPFSRGVSTDGPAGLGLGLALSQSLARAMGGDLDYRPEPAGGARFVLRLPSEKMGSDPIICRDGLSKTIGYRSKPS